jgi:predicted DNA binding CopG/RHH family protein
MRKLSKLEKKIFNYLDGKIDDVYNGKQAIKMLRDIFGYDDQESRDLYINWYFSKGEDYETFELDEEKNLYQFIKKISSLGSSDEIDEYTDYVYDNDRNFLERIYGDYFSIPCGTWNSSTPCIVFEKTGINLELSKEDWMEYFSGLSDEDSWIYYQINSSYISDWENVDKDELNYISYDGETIGYLEKLALISGQSEWPGKTDGRIELNEINNFLEKVLPKEYYSDFNSDVLNEISYAVTYSRMDAAKKEYKDIIKYDASTTSCHSGQECIHIPYEDLLNFIAENNLKNLSELKNIGVNPDVYLNETWWDTYIDDERNDNLVKEINKLLDYYINKILDDEDIDLEELIKERQYILDMFQRLKLNEPMKGWFLSKDGKIEVRFDEVDLKNKKIKFKYEGENHIVPYEDFPNWVQGSVLDLNESVRFGKRLLKEDKETINKISIFDFDGTLMDTPNQDQGKKEWEKIKKEKYPYKGWWDKPESLDDSVFDIRPIESTISDYEKEKSNPNTLVIMLTGRIPHLSEQVEELLSLYNLNFDEYHYKSNGSTLNSKKNTIKSLLNRYPNVKTIEMWEDRLPHIKSFEEFGKDNDINIKVNEVSTDKSPISESREEKYNLFLDKIVDKLIRDTRYFLSKGSRTISDYSEPVLVDVIFPMYDGYDIFYTKDEIKEWMNNPEWLLGTEDLEYFNNIYGLNRVETQIVLNKFLLIVAPLLFEQMDNFTEFEWEDGYKSMGLMESEDKTQKFYDKVINVIKPPYINYLYSMGLDYIESEKILSKLFGEKVYIEDDSVLSMVGLVVSEPTEFLVVSASEGYVLYSENIDGEWEFYEFRKLNKGEIFNESNSPQKRYVEKVLQILKKPYFYNLRNMDVPEGYWSEIFSNIYNQPVKIGKNPIILYDDDIVYDINSHSLYQEESEYYWIERKYNDNGRMTGYVNSKGDWEKTEYNDSGEMIYYENSYGKLEDYRDGTNINESTEDVKNKYVDKIIHLLKPPYIHNLRSFDVPRELWEPILKIIFNNTRIVIDGVTQDQTNLIEVFFWGSDHDPIYTEWSDLHWIDFRDGSRSKDLEDSEHLY